MGELMNSTAKGISEDWLSVWIGLLVFVLALGMLAGTDILGWVVTTQPSRSVPPATPSASTNTSRPIQTDSQSSLMPLAVGFMSFPF